MLLQDAEIAFAAARQPRGDAGIVNNCVIPFRNAVREVEGTFLHTSRDVAKQVIVAFQNPSIRDFVEAKLRSDQATTQAILERCQFFEQVAHLHRLVHSLSDDLWPLSSPWGAALVRAAVRTLHAESCRLVSVQTDGGRLRYHREAVTVEQRLEGVFAATRTPGAQEASSEIEHLVKDVVASWRDGNISPKHLEEVLDAADESPVLSEETKRELKAGCATGLLDTDGDVVVFRVYGELIERLPAASEEAMRGFREKFMDSLDAMLDVSGCHDGGTAHEQIDEVRWAADALAIDIGAEVERAKERADRIGEPEYERPDDAWEDEGSGSHPEILSDDEIDQVFAGLALEPRDGKA